MSCQGSVDELTFAVGLSVIVCRSHSYITDNRNHPVVDLRIGLICSHSQHYRSTFCFWSAVLVPALLVGLVHRFKDLLITATHIQ